MRDNNLVLSRVAVMLSFFAMGILDLIGIGTNYIKVDFNLSDTTIGILSFMLFLSFLLFSIPTSLLMHKIGAKKTVVLSILIMAVALSSLLLTYNMLTVVVFFMVLGIGITFIQVALSPLLANIVSSKGLASALTFGQFVKALGSAIIPIIAAWISLNWGSWIYLLPFLLVYSLIVVVVLLKTPIKEKKHSQPAGFNSTLQLLRKPVILISFLAMLCHVGLDVGMNIASPRLMVERTACSVEVGTYANTIYFVFRTLGCLLGSILLTRVAHKHFFNVSVAVIILGMIGLFFADTTLSIYSCIGLIAVGNSNIFPIIVAKCMLYLPNQKNEVSALMIMGLFGGALFPLLMGVISDLFHSQIGGIWVLLLGVAYMATWTIQLGRR